MSAHDCKYCERDQTVAQQYLDLNAAHSDRDRLAAIVEEQGKELERMRGDFLEALALGLGWMRIANVENSEEVAELDSDIKRFNATIDRLHGLYRKGGE